LKLDVEWLTVFDAVMRTGGVSRAAEHLGMAQATASTALAKLRAYYGDPLFSRGARGMRPTHRAQALHADVRELLARLDSMRQQPDAFLPHAARRNFRICMTDISEVVLLPTLVNHLRRTAPGVDIDVERISADSPRRLEEGEVDLAVGFMPQLDAGFYQQVLFLQDFVCMVAQQHPRVQHRLTRKAYVRECHVVVSSSGTGHVVVEKTLRSEQVERKVVLRVPSFLGLARIVADTELIATVPERFAEAMQAQERIRVTPLPYEMPGYAVKQHWHARFHADPGNRWLRATVAELLGTGAGPVEGIAVSPRP